MKRHRQLVIRPAQIADGEGIAPLLAQLGYPAGPEEARARLERVLAAPGAGVLVAEVGDGGVAGVAVFQVFDLLERPRPQCRLTALVVDVRYRRHGVAAALVDAVVERARERGCFRLEVTTHPRRAEAVAFYAELGFEERRHRFVKNLA